MRYGSYTLPLILLLNRRVAMANYYAFNVRGKKLWRQYFLSCTMDMQRCYPYLVLIFHSSDCVVVQDRFPTIKRSFPWFHSILGYFCDQSRGEWQRVMSSALAKSFLPPWLSAAYY